MPEKLVVSGGTDDITLTSALCLFFPFFSLVYSTNTVATAFFSSAAKTWWPATGIAAKATSEVVRVEGRPQHWDHLGEEAAKEAQTALSKEVSATDGSWEVGSPHRRH